MSRHGYEVEVLRDLTYAQTGGKARLVDLYIPRGVDSGPVPVIVWLHGGGWRLGDRKLGPDLSRFFAQHGFAMASIDYRLSDEAIFPGAVEDVKTAVRWLRSVSADYGFDSGRIGLWGSSSGGHLAALAALSGSGVFETSTSEHATYSSEVQAVVDGYGPTDFLQIDEHRGAGVESDDPESVQLPAGLRSAAADSFESRFLGAPIETRPDLVRQANPAAYAKAGAPPFLILHGLSDSAVPPHQSERLYTALTEKNNAVTLCLIPQLGHGFLNRDHLDDGPERRLTLQGTPLLNSEGGIVSLIEAFFRLHLLQPRANS